MEDIQKEFRDHGHTHESAFLFKFLDDADALPSVRQYRDSMLEMCPVTKGQSILDVGCGLGHEALRLAERVGPGGMVLGIDISDSFIDEARRRATKRGSSARFEIGNVSNLEFPEGKFDLCRTERVLLYLDDPLAGLSEIVRVVRPGGHVVVFDFDYGGFIIDSDNETLTRRIEALFAEEWRHPMLGRQLPHYFRKIGLGEISIKPHFGNPPLHLFKRIVAGALEAAVSKGKVSTHELNEWWRGLDEADSVGQFYTADLGFVVCGRKP